jgi:N-acetylmuramoyl-L-alanine amidase
VIKKSKVNGVDISYIVANPETDKIHATLSIGKTIKDIAQAESATVAANFNFADTNTGRPIGRVIVDGKAVIADIAKTVSRHELYMDNGTLHIGRAPTDAEWSLQGSPRLLQAGENVIASSVERDQTGVDIWHGKAYRLAAGITAAGKLVLVRTLDKVTLDVLAGIMSELGCTDALNGDGGGSAYLWPADNDWGRKMGAALIIKEEQNMTTPFKLIGDTKPELVIDPGHGGKDPGGGSSIYWDPQGFYERDKVLQISLYQYKRFKELGVKVALTRDSDITLDSTTRPNLVKNSGAKYCISNHINAASATTAAGVETIHSVYSDGKLATALMQAIADAGQIKRKTPVFTKIITNESGAPVLANGKKQDYYFMHRLTGNVGTVIIEYGFATNPGDAERIKNNWQAYAEAVVKAYCAFAGHKYTPPATVTPEPTPTPQPEKPKDDVTGHWAVTEINAVKAAGLMSGFPDGTFRPDEPVTRAQLAVVLNRIK